MAARSVLDPSYHPGKLDVSGASPLALSGSWYQKYTRQLSRLRLQMCNTEVNELWFSELPASVQGALVGCVLSQVEGVPTFSVQECSRALARQQMKPRHPSCSSIAVLQCTPSQEGLPPMYNLAQL